MKLKQFLLTVCTLIVAVIGFAKVGHAQSVSYQTYKYGTSTTSMADGNGVKRRLRGYDDHSDRHQPIGLAGRRQLHRRPSPAKRH